MTHLSNPLDSGFAIDEQQQAKHQVIYIFDIVEQLGLTKPEIYLSIREGQFPSPVDLCERELGFLKSEFDDIYGALRRGATLKDISVLVFNLHQQRTRSSLMSNA